MPPLRLWSFAPKRHRAATNRSDMLRSRRPAARRRQSTMLHLRFALCQKTEGRRRRFSRGFLSFLGPATLKTTLEKGVIGIDTRVSQEFSISVDRFLGKCSYGDTICFSTENGALVPVLLIFAKPQATNLARNKEIPCFYDWRSSISITPLAATGCLAVRPHQPAIHITFSSLRGTPEFAFAKWETA